MSQNWKIAHRRVITDPATGFPILRRWTLVETPLFGIKVHHILVSDPIARGYHDHPWTFLSIRLRDLYTEHVVIGGQQLTERKRISVRRASTLHRVELPDGAKCWTLVITGPRRNVWGFVPVPKKKETVE